MPAVARNGDPCGGTIVATATTVRVNGLPIALVTDEVTSHGENQHAGATLQLGSSTVRAEGRPVCRQGDPATCGHTISSASPTVSAGG